MKRKYFSFLRLIFRGGYIGLDDVLRNSPQRCSVIDEILSMPIDSLLTVPKVPDRLLSPLVTHPRRAQQSHDAVAEVDPPLPSRSSTTNPSLPNIDITLPSALSPPYLPTKPVSSVWSARHTTTRLYRYTHFERIVYPHQRVIVPPAFVR